jgi:hypothetical protein
MLEAGIAPSTLFGPMAHVDSEKFHEVMTCFYLAAQSAGHAEAGAVFERAMLAIASSLPNVPPGSMHAPTLHLCQSQLPSVPATAFCASPHPPSPTRRVESGRAETEARPSNLLTLAAETAPPAVLAEQEQHGATDAISPSSFPEFIGYDSKRVVLELRRRYPRACIEILREGMKLRGVKNDRIVVVVDGRGDIVAAPRVG